PKVKVNALNNEAFRYACKNGHVEIVKMLLATGGVNAAVDNNIAIRHAAMSGDLEIVKLLLEVEGVDAGALGNKAIISAAKNGHLEVVKLLMKAKGVDVNADNRMPLRSACKGEHLEIVRLLMDYERERMVETMPNQIAVNGEAIPSSSSSSPSPSPSSYWDHLPHEIKEAILDKCDLLTQYLNNHLSKQQINKYAHQIWILAIKFNYTGDLAALPPSLPNARNGLAEVSSKDFYQRLCHLRPDLTGTNIIKDFFKDEHLWSWLLPTDGTRNYRDASTDKFGIFFKEVTGSVAGMMTHEDLISMLLHIPLRQYWTKDETCIEFINLDKIKVFVIAGSFCHIKLFHQLLHELTKNQAICFASERGHVDVVKVLLETPGVDASAVNNYAIRRAAKNGHYDVVKVLVGAKGVDPGDCENEAFYAACEYDHVKVVEELLKVEVVRAGVNFKKAVLDALGNDQAEIVKVLLEVEGVYSNELCVQAFDFATRRGHIDVVEMLTQVQRGRSSINTG
ncbi:hypothetical protein HDU76_008209, partial [Blyttiomyces sp. JEL0837]